MNKRLTEEQCYKLYEEYGTPDRVIAHCREVSRCACLIADRLVSIGYDLDIDLIRSTGLIHDLVRTRDKHDVEAGKILDGLGYCDEAEIVKDHMSYVFNDLPEITNHDVVCLADRIVKEHEYVGIDERVEYLIAKYSENIERTERLLYWKEEVRKYINKIEDMIGISFDELLSPDLESLLKRVEKPARYIGGEINEVIKNPEEQKLRMAFAFPDLYEIGMSYLGIQILYDIVNKIDGMYMERVFEPAPDMCELMRKTGKTLFTLETKTPVKNMDVLGFTLQYELSYTDILDMLDLSGMPLKAEDRDESYPLVIAGGPCAFTPEPLADFVDVFLIGDGEKLLPDFLAAYRESKERNESRKTFLENICMMKGVYVPSLYEPEYNEDGTIRGYKTLCENAPLRVEKAIIKNLDKADFPLNNIVPNIETLQADP